MPYPILAEQQTWYKGTTDKSTITQIDILTSYTPATTPSEQWNADTGNTGAIKCYVEGTKLTIAGDGSDYIEISPNATQTFEDFSSVIIINNANLLDTHNVTNMTKMFNRCSALTTVDVSGFDLSNVTTIHTMFQHCNAINNLDLNNWDVSKVTDMTGAFNQCLSLSSLAISNWDVSNVIIIFGLFNSCEVLNGIDVSRWNVSKVTNMGLMFKGCSALTTLDVSNWDVGQVTTMSNMFSNCKLLSTVDVSNWDVSNVTDMSNMFYHCFALTELDVSNWDVGQVTCMGGMFNGDSYGSPCVPLTELDVSKWDTSSCTDMGWMFYGCKNLTTLDVSKWNVSKVECFHHMFAWCTNLVLNDMVTNWDTSSATTFNAIFHRNKNTHLDLSKWDTSKSESFSQMFEYNKELVEIKGLNNWNTSSGKDFVQMFFGCNKLKSLDLSSFDTTNADYTWIDPQNGQKGGMTQMLGGKTEETSLLHTLEKIILGEKFTLKGNGYGGFAEFPTPNPTYIDGADGNWYTEEGVAYSSENIPNRTYGVYYASLDLIDKKYLIKFGTLTKIANAIRTKAQTSNKILASDMADTILAIGASADGKPGYDDGYADGRQAEYDYFWDHYLDYGNKTNYFYAFSGATWTEEIFKPKYNIKPTSESEGIFLNADINVDLVEYLDNLGVTLDLSKATSLSKAFQKTEFTRLGLIDTTNITACSNLFANSNLLKTIDILKCKYTNTWSSAFAGCSALENLTIEGEIGKAVSFADCKKLSHDSLISIINHLRTVTTAITLTLGTTNLEKLTDAEKAIATTEKGWTLA